jgi:hypothetical protein
MHNFEQVKDVLEYGQKTHADLQSFYRSINDEKQQTRVQMLLDYLSQHEQHLEEALADFEGEAKKQILETWLQYKPSINIEKLIGDQSIQPNMPMDEVTKIAIDFDNALIELYRESAAAIDVPQVKQVFENLLEMENHEKLRFVRDAGMLKDI